VLSWASFGLVFALVVLAFGAAAQGLFPEAWSKVIPFGSVLVFLLALASLANLATGWNLLDARRAVEAWLEPRLQKRLYQWFGPSESS
jgi:hypothetical protein